MTVCLSLDAIVKALFSIFPTIGMNGIYLIYSYVCLPYK